MHIVHSRPQLQQWQCLQRWHLLRLQQLRQSTVHPMAGMVVRVERVVREAVCWVVEVAVLDVCLVRKADV